MTFDVFGVITRRAVCESAPRLANLQWRLRSCHSEGIVRVGRYSIAHRTVSTPHSLKYRFRAPKNELSTALLTTIASQNQDAASSMMHRVRSRIVETPSFEERAITIQDDVMEKETISGDKSTNSKKLGRSVRSFLSSPLCGLLSPSPTTMPSIIITETGTNMVLNAPIDDDDTGKRAHKTSRQSDTLQDKLTQNDITSNAKTTAAAPSISSSKSRLPRNKNSSVAVFWDVSRVDKKDVASAKGISVVRTKESANTNTSANSTVKSNDDETRQESITQENQQDPDPIIQENHDEPRDDDDTASLWFPAQADTTPPDTQAEAPNKEEPENAFATIQNFTIFPQDSSIHKYLECYRYREPESSRDPETESCF